MGKYQVTVNISCLFSIFSVVKSLTYILLGIYLFFTVGVTIATHVCDGEIRTVSFAVNHSEQEHNCCDMECESLDCSTNFTFIKLNEVQKTESSKWINIITAKPLDSETFSDTYSASAVLTITVPAANSDPPVYLLCGTFLI